VIQLKANLTGVVFLQILTFGVLELMDHKVINSTLFAQRTLVLLLRNQYGQD